jgi:hypothetical protein
MDPPVVTWRWSPATSLDLTIPGVVLEVQPEPSAGDEIDSS